MPNWCNNYAEIHGPKATIKALHDAIINEGKFFGHMRPEPNYEEVDVYPTFPGIKGNNDPVEKSQSWWDWRVQNWGTKWELGDEMKSIFTYEEVMMNMLNFLAASILLGRLRVMLSNTSQTITKVFRQLYITMSPVWDSVAYMILMAVMTTMIFRA